MRVHLALLPLLTAALLPAAPLRVLIITGSSDEPFHHWRETTASIREILEKSGHFDVRVNEEPRGINAAALEGYDAVALNYNGPRLPPGAETALEAFVRSGRGLVSFHQACYGAFFGMEFRDRKWRAGTDAGWTAFARMIGATWEPEKIGHARRGLFQVNWKDGRPGFTANDELYHRLTLHPAVQVLADALSPAESGGTGKREPLIWTNRYGAGRVFFTTLGHDKTAWAQPGMMDAFVRVRSGAALNNGDYMVRSTLITLMGQFACYSGKEITWEQISNSDFCHLPRPQDVGAETEAPVKPGQDGIYPLPYTPGVSKLL